MMTALSIRSVYACFHIAERAAFRLREAAARIAVERAVLSERIDRRYQ